MNRKDCIWATALHEFGHALAFHHEQLRPDTPTDCNAAPLSGYTTVGPFDDWSIMSYCNFPTALSALDRWGVDFIYGQPYGDSPNLTDYNGDGRADLLCHDLISGKRWVDHASSSGTFNATDSVASNGWCTTPTQRLYAGDFNGDGRDDLLCWDTNSGRKWVDYASSGGHFGETNWIDTSNWCSHDNGRLLLGDFNGDGQDDLMCVDLPSGDKWVDLASSDGRFGSTNWHGNIDWCSHSTARLFVGDVNGDSRDDLICHDVNTAQKWVNLAESGGRFNTHDHTGAAGWCVGAQQQLH